MCLKKVTVVKEQVVSNCDYPFSIPAIQSLQHREKMLMELFKEEE